MAGFIDHSVLADFTLIPQRLFFGTQTDCSRPRASEVNTHLPGESTVVPLTKGK